MSPRKRPAPEPLPPVVRAKGITAVGQMAVKILQQQLEDFKNRRLLPDERAFLIDAVKALAMAGKARVPRGTSPAAQGPTPAGKDPLKTLGE
jgi:hypothetical protein